MGRYGNLEFYREKKVTWCAYATKRRAVAYKRVFVEGLSGENFIQKLIFQIFPAEIERKHH